MPLRKKKLSHLRKTNLPVSEMAKRFVLCDPFLAQVSHFHHDYHPVENAFCIQYQFEGPQIRSSTTIWNLFTFQREIYLF